MKTRIKRLQSSVSSPKSAVCGLQSAVSGRRTASAGFTLIELMMVILVILLLSGMLLKISAIIRDRSERAKTTADLENIQHALNEYYAEYGRYPPVQDTEYVYEDANLQPPSMRDSKAPITADQIGYKYGLYAHLYNRKVAGADQKRPYNKDTARDEAAKARWAHYLADVATGGSPSVETNKFGGDFQTYSNGTKTIKDAWGGGYKYESHAPYQTYKLWSSNLD